MYYQFNKKNMNKNIGIIIGIVIIVLIIVGVYASTSSKNDSAMMETDENVITPGQSEDDAMEQVEKSDTMMKAGSYEAYSPEKLALADNGDVVLFFRASWCPTCRALDSDIRTNINSIPPNVIILDVDYDNSTTLKQKYGVTYQHTLVQVDSSGNQIAKWTNSPTLVSLITNIK